MEFLAGQENKGGVIFLLNIHQAELESMGQAGAAPIAPSPTQKGNHCPRRPSSSLGATVKCQVPTRAPAEIDAHPTHIHDPSGWQPSGAAPEENVGLQPMRAQLSQTGQPMTRPHHTQPGTGFGQATRAFLPCPVRPQGQQAGVNLGPLSQASSDPVSAQFTSQPRGTSHTSAGKPGSTWSWLWEPVTSFCPPEPH